MRETSYAEMMTSVTEAYESEELTPDPDMRAKLKRKVLKNVVLISVAFLMLFTSYGGLSALQSSLHKDDGMGTINQSVLYAAMVLSCLFVPELLINSVGHKWAISISMFGYIIWMAANGYAVWGTMVPASILAGISAAALWTAKCTYFAKITPLYCKITGDTTEAVMSRFFGIFFFFFQLSSVIGSIISSTILRPSRASDENNTLSQKEVYEYCGINDCPWNNVTNPGQSVPGWKTLWTMVGVYLGVACCAVTLASVFVDNLPKYLEDDTTKVNKEMRRRLTKTAAHIRNKYQLLLIPITVYNGMEPGFRASEWNRSYVSCTIGIWMVGLVQIPGSIVNAMMSLSVGHLVKYTGRIPVFTFGFLLQLAVQLFLLCWPLDTNKEYMFYIMSALWGMCDGVWQTQINAIYGAIFSDNCEAAFANHRMWQSLGFILAFAWSDFLCTDVKLYILIGALTVGMILYYTLEIVLRRTHREVEFREMCIVADNGPLGVKTNSKEYGSVQGTVGRFTDDRDNKVFAMPLSE